MLRASHYTVRTPTLSAHLHYPHTYTIRTPTLSAHQHYPHTYTIRTPTLSAHLHYPHTNTIRTPTLSAHQHYPHTNTIRTPTLSAALTCSGAGRTISETSYNRTHHAHTAGCTCRGGENGPAGSSGGRRRARRGWTRPRTATRVAAGRGVTRWIGAIASKKRVCV
jgi:hypothetical protein